MTASGLERAIGRLDAAVGRLEGRSVELLEELVGRRLAERADDPAILRAPLVRAAGIRLQDVLLDPGPIEAPTANDDPQAEFDRLAEVYAAEAGGDLSVGYRRASRAHPGLWRAAREAAYLDDGPKGMQ